MVFDKIYEVGLLVREDLGVVIDYALTLSVVILPIVFLLFGLFGFFRALLRRRKK